MSDVERVPMPGHEAVPVQPEQSVEQEGGRPEDIASRQPSAPVQIAMSTSIAAPSQHGTTDPRSGVLKQVEGLLADGLQSLYLSLPESGRAAFKRNGEAVAQKITDMIIIGKVKVKEVWKLIGEWLRVVPGVNRYFLEQEIKIKTDRIMMFAESSAKTS